MFELWRDIPGYEGLYKASSFGRIKSVKRYVKGPPNSQSGLRLHKERILKPTPSRTGQQIVALYKYNKGQWRLLSRLVLLAFRGPCPPGQECCHFDGNSTNNRLSNLRWGTSSANKQDRNHYGTHQLGSRGTTTRLTAEEVRSIRLRYRHGEHVTALISEFKGRGSAADVIYGTTWQPEKYYRTICAQLEFIRNGGPETFTTVETTLAELELIDVDGAWFAKALEEVSRARQNFDL